MTFKSTLTWTTRVLAVIGLIAIVLVGARSIFYTVSVSTGSYGGDYADFAVMDAEFISEESIVRSTAPGALYDEAIAAEVDQKIIKTGTLELVVDAADESVTAIEDLVEETGGYVSSSTLREHEDGTLSGYMTVRVPSENFESSLDQIKSLAVVVERETTSAEDVTEDYIDLSARLANAQAQETRYVEILAFANTVEEILEVEEALGDIRGYIESLQGQLDYLESLSSFSTITIDLSEEPVVTIGGKEFRPGTSVREAGQAVVAIAQALVIAIIWIVIVGVGVGVPLALIVWLIWKLIHRIRRR